MQTGQQTQAQIPPQLQMGLNSSEIVVEQHIDKRMYAVFYVGDWLINRQKQPGGVYRLGGKFFFEQKTVPNGFLARCAITPLQQGMMSVASDLIDKPQWINFVKSYTAKNVYNPATGKYEDVKVGSEGASANLLFKPVYPAAELGQIAGRSDGVVYVPGLENAADIKEAQLYYFPNWIEIITGREFLPTRLAHLQDGIQEKLLQTQDSALIGVGQALVQSCEDYRAFGKAYIAFQTARIKDAEKITDVSQRYDEIAERLFEQLELTRQDSLIADFARQNNSSAETNEQFKQAFVMLTNALAKPQSGESTQIAQLSENVATLASIVGNLMQMQAQQQNQPLPPPAPAPATLEDYEKSLASGQVADVTTANADANEAGEAELSNSDKLEAEVAALRQPTTPTVKKGDASARPPRTR